MKKRDAQKKFDKIIKDIKEVKIQGARNIAKHALYAYSLIPSILSKKKLLASRPTEPMMENVLSLAEEGIDYKYMFNHFEDAQLIINYEVMKLIKKNDVIFTHCHSSNVIKSLIYSHNQGKKFFEVYNTETRPLFQGRKTAKELSNAGIKTTMFVDSALGIAITKEMGTKKVTKIFLGADAITKEGVINKVGSRLISQFAKQNKIPVYIIADSWKFTNKKIPLEQRKLNEVWDKAPKNIKIMNPAFEFIPKKYVSYIISEHGSLSYRKFIKIAKKVNP
jgi:translation initiation factor 2B subunit (eIF-2B alpha/beta/delta family)